MDQAIRTWIRDYKERIVKAMNDNNPGDITPVVAFERDEKFAVVAFASEVNRDEGLRIADVGAVGFGADALWWCADIHFSYSPINPATGKQWGPGEMQHGCDHEGACDLGLIQDALLAIRWHRKEGLTDFNHLPYNVDKTRHQVIWHAEMSAGIGEEHAISGLRGCRQTLSCLGVDCRGWDY